MKDKNSCNPKWKRWCIAFCSSQLWIFPTFLLMGLIAIEGIHTKSHREMKLDVHGYCKKNAEHQENLRLGDDW